MRQRKKTAAATTPVADKETGIREDTDTTHYWWGGAVMSVRPPPGTAFRIRIYHHLEEKPDIFFRYEPKFG